MADVINKACDITLEPCAYKLYCSVLNNRLIEWLDEREVIKDEQNGFIKGRSTIDHISTSTSIIETRKKCKLSTFVSFIDVKKAYDIIDRYLLFNKLDNLDLSSKFMLALKAIYSNIECCVRLNGHTVTEQKFLYDIYSYENSLCNKSSKRNVFYVINACSTDIIKIPVQWNMYYIK